MSILTPDLIGTITVMLVSVKRYQTGDSNITDYFCLFSERDICSLPLETPCEHTDPRPNWYYNSDVGVCKEVPDGGF